MISLKPTQNFVFSNVYRTISALSIFLSKHIFCTFYNVLNVINVITNVNLKILTMSFPIVEATGFDFVCSKQNCSKRLCVSLSKVDHLKGTNPSGRQIHFEGGAFSP